MPATTRDPENENMQPGSPPKASTGSEGTNTAKTRTDPSSGETQSAGHAPNKAAAEERPPAGREDRRVKPEA